MALACSRSIGRCPLDWYRQIADQDLYRIVARNTLAIAIPTTVISVVGGYAIGYYLVFGATRGRRLLLTLVVVAMLASYLARIYAWRTLMGEQGIVNSALISIGVTDKPVSWLLFSRVPVVAAEVNLFMPIAALISFASLSGVPPEVREVARDLGAGPVQTLRRITVPLSGPWPLRRGGADVLPLLRRLHHPCVPWRGDQLTDVRYDDCHATRHRPATTRLAPHCHSQ